MTWRWSERFWVGGLLIAFVVLQMPNLAYAPPLWRDEGWTLTVARNWIERGHYGMFLAGEPAPPGLAAAFPTVASVALSFRWLGVGVWQGRLVQVVFAAGTLALLFALARRLYDRRVAFGTLFVVVCLSGHLEANLLYIGRQVLAEPLMLFFLLLGYWCFLRAFERWIFLPFAALAWGIALFAKLQPLPFWSASLLIPLGWLIVARQYPRAMMVGASFIGAIIVYQGAPFAQSLIVQNPIPASPILRELFFVTAFVAEANNHLFALTAILLIGLPTLFGLVYAVWQFSREMGASKDPKVLVRWMLLVLAGSWFIWYSALSVGWIRYFFPVVCIGSIFAAKFLCDATSGFDAAKTLQRVGDLLLRRRANRTNWGALVALILLSVLTPITLQQLARLRHSDSWAERTARRLNELAPDALIESYDNELFFWLDRRYHFPPDQVSVALIRRVELGQNIDVDYNPLNLNPDYLVVGRYGKESGVYDAVLASGAFRWLERSGPFDIYQRVR